ncbi:MAG: histidine kinase [Thermotogae bacterium]|nr:histidine kinase [Thermotogota bacterium]
MKEKSKRFFFLVELASLVLFLIYIVKIGYMNIWLSFLLSFGVINLSALSFANLNKFFEIPLKGKKVKRFIFLINLIVSVVFGVFLMIFLIRLLILKRPVLSEGEIFPIVIALLSSTFLITLAYMMLKNRYQKQVLKAEYLKRVNLESKLKAFQSRLDSHFLFNILENIAEILRTSPEVGEEAILRLAELYRETLNAPMLWTLKREIDFIKRYLELEKIRFSNELEYRINIPEDMEGIKIPPLLIQPLVENAISHGLRYSKGGVIMIEASRFNELVVIQIINSGTFSGKIDFGHGLSIVQDRSRSYFGNAASIHIYTRGKDTVAELKFKYKEQEDEG